MKIEIGNQVVAHSHTNDCQYVIEMVKLRREHVGIVGTVVARHDSKGECFDLRYDDGTLVTFDPDEIRLV